LPEYLLVSARIDLRTGVSIWQKGRIQATSRGNLTRDVRADVIVVGAGVSGALIAEMLTSNGHDVVVVDRRGPARGSTAASTALVLYEIDEPLSSLSTLIGKTDAMRAWRRSQQAVTGLAARTTELEFRVTLNIAPVSISRATVSMPMACKRRQQPVPKLVSKLRF
jgi:ribulose 1,5-bisphosphate synthetase/thiazole synthase